MRAKRAAAARARRREAALKLKADEDARFAADEAYRENLRQARAEALSKATIERQKREAIEDRKREKELVKALGDGSRNWRPSRPSRTRTRSCRRRADRERHVAYFHLPAEEWRSATVVDCGRRRVTILRRGASSA